MRTSAPLAAVLALVASMAAAGERATIPALPGVAVNPEPTAVPDFTLTDHAGKPRAFSSLRGEPVLVFFGFTHCPNVCPTTLGRLKLLHEADGGSLRDARILFISVDGDRDTPARLASYLEPVSSGITGLTGDPKATAQIAAGFAAVFFKEPPAKDGGYNVMHSTQVYAVDKGGRLRATFNDASIGDMAKVTSLLLAEPG
jgi:protein SCO1/2